MEAEAVKFTRCPVIRQIFLQCREYSCVLASHLGSYSSRVVEPSLTAIRVVAAVHSGVLQMPSCVRLVICFLNGCRCSHDDHIPANYSTLQSVWETLALCICQMENITNHTGG